MSNTHYSTCYEGYTEPFLVPSGKDRDAALNSYYNTSGTYSVSPPEVEPSVSSGVGCSSTSGGTYSYAGSSSGDYDSTGSAAGIDFNEYMQDRFAESFDPIPLDRSVARQAQT